MIEPSALIKSDKGRKVVYHPLFCPHQEGVLTSWNDKFVFVRFNGPTGEACEPEDVSFLRTTRG